MASLNAMIRNGEVCQCLRTKTMFYQGDLEDESGSYGPFWCALTQALQGPDGGVASADDCRPGRSCCEIA